MTVWSFWDGHRKSDGIAERPRNLQRSAAINSNGEIHSEEVLCCVRRYGSSSRRCLRPCLDSSELPARPYEWPKCYFSFFSFFFWGRCSADCCGEREHLSFILTREVRRAYEDSIAARVRAHYPRSARARLPGDYLHHTQESPGRWTHSSNQRGTQHDSVAPDCGRSRVARRNRIGRGWRESSLGNRYVLRLAQRCELSVGHSHFGTLSGV